jgi:glycosyltransferase involved in cell wall biosynthesis
VKILLVTHRYPPHTGGVETHIHEVATRLAARGHDVTVFTADGGSTVQSRTNDEAVTVRRFRSFSPDDAFYVAPQITTAIRQVDADIVHAHNYHAFPLFFAATGVSNERFVVTTHYHGHSADRVRDALLSLYRPLGRWAVRRADEVVAVSEWERHRLHEDFGVDGTVIPNGLDIGRYENADPERREQPYLLSVGRLEEYKGVQHVVRALSRLDRYQLVVAGDGPYREQLARLADDIGVADRIELLGYVPNEQLPGLYAGADVFLNLSSFESYGITVAESLAAGTPCVVRESGALTDWTKNTGVVGVEMPAPDRIQAAIDSVTNTRVCADSILTWEQVVDELERVYRDKGDVTDSSP